MVKALARALRWRRLLEEGIYATVAELAAAEAINASYVSRVLRMTLLAPEIIEAVLDGRKMEELSMPRLLQPLPVEWDEQDKAIRKHKTLRHNPALEKISALPTRLSRPI